MAMGVGTRLAGKALGDFLKVATTTLASGVESKVLGKLAESANYADAPGLAGIVARHPETVAKLAGAAAPAAVLGGTAAGVGLLSSVLSGGDNTYAQSQYSLPLRNQGSAVSFANQQYMPGLSPMTNQSMAESLLEQQRFQHQLQLINARQSAQQSVGIGGRTTGSGLDIMGLSQQIFAPVQY